MAQVVKTGSAPPLPKESRWLEGGDHNDLYDFGAAQVVVEFLQRRLGVPGPQGSGG